MSKPSSAHATEQHSTDAKDAQHSSDAAATASETGATCLVLAVIAGCLWFFVDGEVPAPPLVRAKAEVVEQVEADVAEPAPEPAVRRRGPLDARRRLRSDGVPRRLTPGQLNRAAPSDEAPAEH